MHVRKLSRAVEAANGSGGSVGAGISVSGPRGQRKMRPLRSGMAWRGRGVAWRGMAWCGVACRAAPHRAALDAAYTLFMLRSDLARMRSYVWYISTCNRVYGAAASR